MSKTIVMFFMTIGSMLGAYVPLLWGASAFSLTSLAGSVVGGLFGIWFAFRFFG